MVDGTARLSRLQSHRPPFWRDIRVLQFAGQFVFALIVIVVIWQLANNVLDALRILGQTPDFRFWLPDNFFQQPGRLSFTEGPGLVSTDTFGRAFVVGIINTLRAVVVGIVAATLLGIVVGVSRLSRNWLVRNLAAAYVELFQNTPLLLQLIFIYRGVFLALPDIQEAIAFPSAGFRDVALRLLLYSGITVAAVGGIRYLRGLLRARGRPGGSDLGGLLRIGAVVLLIALAGALLFALPLGSVYISKRGLVIPAFVANPALTTWLAVAGVALLAALVIWHQRREHERRTGQPGYAVLWSVGALIAILLAAWLLTGEAPFSLDYPLPQIANLSDGRQVIRRIVSGETLTTEYAALTVGLILYTAAFIGEIVRAGIQAVPYGQTEAAQAIGLSKTQTLQLVILPQALRIIIPPLGNQYLNLTKNSSLATAIAYLDVFAIATTIINQAGRGVVTIIAVMLVYLAASLFISAVMNYLNSRMRLKER